MSAELWHEHGATPKQARLAFKSSRKRVLPTQADVIVELLRERRALRRPLELAEIMAAGIAQHGARMKEIRNRGFVVRNELERSHDGRVLSRYWLECDPEQDSQP
jgi:hypothetical protein